MDDTTNVPSVRPADANLVNIDNPDDETIYLYGALSPLVQKTELVSDDEKASKSVVVLHQPASATVTTVIEIKTEELSNCNEAPEDALVVTDVGRSMSSNVEDQNQQELFESYEFSGNFEDNLESASDSMTEVQQQSLSNSLAENNQGFCDSVEDEQQGVSDNIVEKEQGFGDSVKDKQQGIAGSVADKQQSLSENVTDKEPNCSETDSTADMQSGCAGDMQPGCISAEDKLLSSCSDIVEDTSTVNVTCDTLEKDVNSTVGTEREKPSSDVNYSIADVEDKEVLQNKATTMRISACNKPLIGLEYIVEFHTTVPKCMPSWYVCTLCNDKFIGPSLITHGCCMKHRVNYMKEKSPIEYQVIEKQQMTDEEHVFIVEERAAVVEAVQGRQKVVLKSTKTTYQSSIEEMLADIMLSVNHKRNDAPNIKSEPINYDEGISVVADLSKRATSTTVVKIEQSGNEIWGNPSVANKETTLVSVVNTGLPVAETSSAVAIKQESSSGEKIVDAADKKNIQSKATSLQVAQCSEPLIGLEYMIELQTQVSKSSIPSWYVCTLCQNKFAGPSLISHGISLKHRFNYMKEALPIEYQAIMNLQIKHDQRTAVIKDRAAAIEAAYGRQLVVIQQTRTTFETPVPEMLKDTKLNLETVKRIKEEPSIDQKAIDININLQDKFKEKESITEIIFACKEPLIGMQFITEYRVPVKKGEQSLFVCNLCEAKFQCVSFITHCTSYKHRVNYMRERFMNYYMMVQQFAKKTEDRVPMVDEYAAEIEKEEGRHMFKTKERTKCDAEPNAAIALTVVKPEVSTSHHSRSSHTTAKRVKVEPEDPVDLRSKSLASDKNHRDERRHHDKHRTSHNSDRSTDKNQASRPTHDHRSVDRNRLTHPHRSPIRERPIRPNRSADRDRLTRRDRSPNRAHRERSSATLRDRTPERDRPIRRDRSTERDRLTHQNRRNRETLKSRSPIRNRATRQDRSADRNRKSRESRHCNKRSPRRLSSGRLGRSRDEIRDSRSVSRTSRLSFGGDDDSFDRLPGPIGYADGPIGYADDRSMVGGMYDERRMQNNDFDLRLGTFNDVIEGQYFHNEDRFRSDSLSREQDMYCSEQGPVDLSLNRRGRSPGMNYDNRSCEPTERMRLDVSDRFWDNRDRVSHDLYERVLPAGDFDHVGDGKYYTNRLQQNNRFASDSQDRGGDIYSHRDQPMNFSSGQDLESGVSRDDMRGVTAREPPWDSRYAIGERPVDGSTVGQHSDYDSRASNPFERYPATADRGEFHTAGPRERQMPQVESAAGGPMRSQNRIAFMGRDEESTRSYLRQSQVYTEDTREESQFMQAPGGSRNSATGRPAWLDVVCSNLRQGGTVSSVNPSQSVLNTSFDETVGQSEPLDFVTSSPRMMQEPTSSQTMSSIDVNQLIVRKTPLTAMEQALLWPWKNTGGPPPTPIGEVANSVPISRSEIERVCNFPGQSSISTTTTSTVRNYSPECVEPDQSNATATAGSPQRLLSWSGGDIQDLLASTRQLCHAIANGVPQLPRVPFISKGRASSPSKGAPPWTGGNAYK